MEAYFDPTVSNTRSGAMALPQGDRKHPAVQCARQDAKTLMNKAGPEAGNFVRFCYRPFDFRWIYWEQGMDSSDEDLPNTLQTSAR